jgi:hypothetical protein
MSIVPDLTTLNTIYHMAVIVAMAVGATVFVMDRLNKRERRHSPSTDENQTAVPNDLVRQYVYKLYKGNGGRVYREVYD